MALSPAVTALTEKLIQAKAELRTASKSAADCLACVSDVGDCDIVRSSDLQHVELGCHREKLAKALYLIERGQSMLCEAHCDLKATANEKGIELAPISTFGGGKR